MYIKNSLTTGMAAMNLNRFLLNCAISRPMMELCVCVWVCMCGCDCVCVCVCVCVCECVCVCAQGYRSPDQCSLNQYPSYICHQAINIIETYMTLYIVCFGKEGCNECIWHSQSPTLQQQFHSESSIHQHRSSEPTSQQPGAGNQPNANDAHVHC